jgi:hypothetical protein
MHIAATSKNVEPLKLETITWVIAIGLTLLALVLPAFRYFAYLIPFLALLHGLAEGRFRIPDASRPLIVLLCAGLALIPLGNTDGYKDLYFITSGVSISLVLSRARIAPYWLFGAFLVGAVAFAAMYGGLSAGFVFDFRRSVSTFEGNFGFLFGLLTVYAATTRRWRLVLISFIASVLALKRIVVLAEITCIVMVLLGDKRARMLLNPWLMVAANLLFVVLVAFYALHSFDTIITRLTDQSPNQFGQGRQELYSLVAQQIYSEPFRFAFVGAGPGAAYDTLGVRFQIFGHTNLHSDVLKIFYEYGFLIFALFFLAGYSSRHTAVKILFLYANILFLSDNVLIYHFFLFFFCAFGLALQTLHEQPASGKAAADG